mgnify:FL=1
MCAPDPNAGIRMQARIEKQKKDYAFHSASIKYWNREVQGKRGRQRIAGGLATARSDAYVKALHALGRGRQQKQVLAADKAEINRGADVGTGESRSRRYGMNKYKQILAKQAQIESSIDTTFRRNMDGTLNRIDKYNRIALARNKEKVGLPPEYGAPVMMPPKDKTGQMFANLQMLLSIGSLGVSAASLGK